MKTNQIMHVHFREGVLNIGHLDHMGDLNQLFDIGNRYRTGKGLASIGRDKYMGLSSTKELIAAVSEKIGRPAYLAKSRKGGFVAAHLYILVDAAMYLDVDFKLEVIEAFVHGQLLRFRDDSGDEFKAMNTMLALNADKVLGKAAHVGHYTNLAKILRSRILPDDHPGWNHATPKQLNERTRIEEAVSNALRMGFIRDWDHLKEVVEKI